MKFLNELRIEPEYCCQCNINLYKSTACESLVTQAAIGRHLRFLDLPTDTQQPAFRVCLCEDDYPGWLAAEDLDKITATAHPYCPQTFTADAIQALIPEAICFAKVAMAHPNHYLWGGTVGPHYDCSGLVQAAFASVGVILPRDSYQQEAFVDPVKTDDWQQGDLLFFGTRDRTTHVALYLGNGQYIHSSGKDRGRNGIGIDSITDRTDPVSQTYYEQLLGAGRVVRSYQPTGSPIACR